MWQEPTNVVKFLMGYAPFVKSLVYSPERHTVDNKIREGDGAEYKTEHIYNEFHTGDWWFETQKKIGEGETIVPLLLGSDKTHLSEHKGDISAHPVYLTIGNLSQELRRSQKLPGTLLLGFVPVIHSPKDSTGKRASVPRWVLLDVYHQSLELMLACKKLLYLELL